MRILSMLCIVLGCYLTGCGTATKAEPYATLTDDEKARQALDDQDFEQAIERYKKLVEGDPENYERYRFLAAAYAAAAGFDIIEAAKSTSSGGESGSLIDSLGQFLPADPSADQMEWMRLSKETLLSIPSEFRSKDNTEVSYAAGAATQLEFYQSSYAIMYINQFAKFSDSGSLDPSRLESMTDEDVENILSNFTQVASTGGAGVPAASQAILTSIEAKEGATQREKLINYLNARK
jgi:hypothetical protein